LLARIAYTEHEEQTGKIFAGLFIKNPEKFNNINRCPYIWQVYACKKNPEKFLNKPNIYALHFK